ncbi:hypothetical protein Dimus_001976 [Dionaea muscipula]
MTPPSSMSTPELSIMVDTLPSFHGTPSHVPSSYASPDPPPAYVPRSLVSSRGYVEHGITTPMEPTTWMQIVTAHLGPSVPPPQPSTVAPPPHSSAPQENNDDDDDDDYDDDDDLSYGLVYIYCDSVFVWSMMEVVDVAFVDLPSVEVVDMIWFSIGWVWFSIGWVWLHATNDSRKKTRSTEGLPREKTEVSRDYRGM